MKCTVNLLGRLDCDPVIERLAGGQQAAILYIVTQETWRDAESGARRSRPTTHRVVVRQSGRAKAAARELKAGDLIDVAGTLAYPPRQAGGGPAAEIQVRAPSHVLLFVDDLPTQPGPPPRATSAPADPSA